MALAMHIPPQISQETPDKKDNLRGEEQRR